MTHRFVSTILTLVLLVSASMTPLLGILPVSAQSGQPSWTAQGALAFCDDVTQVPAQECEALAALYAGTGGPSWTNRGGWMDTNTPCSWFGVICDSGHVDTLNLGNNNLSGSLPAELSSLAFLDTLDFDNNQLTGTIPPELGSLTHLRVLSMERNSLSGAIPASLGSLSQLQEVWLAHNQLSGAIPPEIGGLSLLSTLDLRDNQLNLPLPAELGSLTNLTYLLLQSNQISGSIPPELGNLQSLVSLSLSYNQLSGSLPPELGSLTRLNHLVMMENHLAGSIPPEFGNLANLVVLNLACNRLNGSIPGELGNLKAVTQLSLNGNQLGGDVPPELTLMTALAAPFLDLGYNRLTAAHPAVQAWLNTHDPDWAATQTIPPAGLHVDGFTSTGVALAWIPIAYTGDGGYYEIFQAQQIDGPYTLAGQTTDKAAASFTISSLPSGTTYFAIRAFTPPHDFIMIGPGWNLHQQNPLYSPLSPGVPVSKVQVDPINGGTLDSSDASGSQTIVSVPAGAVSETVTLTLAPSYPIPAPTVDFRFAGYAFGLNASIAGVPQHGFSFNQPVTITLHYNAGDVAGIDENSLILYYWDPGAAQFTDAAESCAPPSSYDRRPQENSLSVPICHLSEFVLFGRPFHVLLPVLHR